MPAPPACIVGDLAVPGPVADGRQSTTPAMAAVEPATKKRKNRASPGPETFFVFEDAEFDAWADLRIAEMYAGWLG